MESQSRHVSEVLSKLMNAEQLLCLWPDHSCCTLNCKETRLHNKSSSSVPWQGFSAGEPERIHGAHQSDPSPGHVESQKSRISWHTLSIQHIQKDYQSSLEGLKAACSTQQHNTEIHDEWGLGSFETINRLQISTGCFAALINFGKESNWSSQYSWVNFCEIYGESFWTIFQIPSAILSWVLWRQAQSLSSSNKS